MHRERRPMKQVVNDALRRGLVTPSPRRRPYHTKVHHSAVRPGLDLAGFNRFADQMEDDAILERGSSPRT